MATLITGATFGLGEAFAKILAEEGQDLVLVARTHEKLMELQTSLQKKYGIRVWVIASDLSLDGSAEDIYEQTQDAGISVDMLVNNAGFGDFGYFSSSDLKKNQAMIQVNISTLVTLTYCYLETMLENGSGKILNIASIASFFPGPMMSVYYASKAFVLSFSEGIAQELVGTGVSVTAYCPGPTKTGFAGRATLEKSGLFQSFQKVEAKDVALDAIKKTRKGKVVSIHGWSNKLLAWVTRFVPRNIVRNLVMKFQK